MAVQRAATPTAGNAPRSVTRKNTCRGEPSKWACSSSSASTSRKPGADDQHDPGHGRHGVDPDGPAPACQPRGGGNSESVHQPWVPKPACQAVACRYNGTSGSSPTTSSAPRRPGKVRPHQQPCQRGPQRQADGAGGRGEQQGIQHQRPGAVVHAAYSISDPAPASKAPPRSFLKLAAVRRGTRLAGKFLLRGGRRRPPRRRTGGKLA